MTVSLGGDYRDCYRLIYIITLPYGARLDVIEILSAFGGLRMTASPAGRGYWDSGCQ